MELSKNAIAALPPKSAPYLMWDDEVPGFGVLILPSGTKSYVAQYRISGEVKSKRRTIARVADMTVGVARGKAAMLIEIANRGIDREALAEAERLKEQEAAHTLMLKNLAEIFLRDHVEAKRKANTLRAYRTLLSTRILPKFGRRDVREITKREVSAWHASQKANPSTANRALASLKTILNWAVDQELLPGNYVNPCRRVERFQEFPRQRFLNAEELHRLGEAIRRAEAGIAWTPRPGPNAKHAPKPDKRIKKLAPEIGDAVRLLIFTGARRNEILKLRWDAVDLEHNLLRLADSKTGPKDIVLNAEAKAILEALAAGRGRRTFVIKGAGDEPRADIDRAWRKITKLAGLEGVVLHSLRHGFATAGMSAGMSLPMIGKLLGHHQPMTTQRYAHSEAKPLLAAANSIGAALAKALGEPIAALPSANDNRPRPASAGGKRP